MSDWFENDKFVPRFGCMNDLNMYPEGHVFQPYKKAKAMALEALPENMKAIGSEPVIFMDQLREKSPEQFNPSGAMNYEWFEREIRPHYHVYVRRDMNSISFTLQKGPIKEVGVNGCQVDTLIEAAAEIIRGLNTKFPCRENSLAITKLEEALHWLEARRKNRIEREVEGTSKA